MNAIFGRKLALLQRHCAEVKEAYLHILQSPGREMEDAGDDDEDGIG